MCSKMQSSSDKDQDENKLHRLCYNVVFRVHDIEPLYIRGMLQSGLVTVIVPHSLSPGGTNYE